MSDKFDSLFAISANESHKLLEPDNVALLVELHTTDPVRFVQLWDYFKSAKIRNLTVLTNQMDAYRRDNPQNDGKGFILSMTGKGRQNVAANYARALEIVLNGDEISGDLDAVAIADLHMKTSNALGFIPDRAVFEAVLRARKTNG